MKIFTFGVKNENIYRISFRCGAEKKLRRQDNNSQQQHFLYRSPSFSPAHQITNLLCTNKIFGVRENGIINIIIAHISRRIYLTIEALTKSDFSSLSGLFNPKQFFHSHVWCFINFGVSMCNKSEERMSSKIGKRRNVSRECTRNDPFKLTVTAICLLTFPSICFSAFLTWKNRKGAERIFYWNLSKHCSCIFGNIRGGWFPSSSRYHTYQRSHPITYVRRILRIVCSLHNDFEISFRTIWLIWSRNRHSASLKCFEFCKPFSEAL